ncbi:MAG: hypothetical protein JW929_14445 [Anaerolineales bacterium]|nr:hypothetical protein [Anaerolineales bacterium]
MTAVKLLMTWDILPGQAQEYFEFIVREFLPGMQKLGVEPTDAWYTAYGDGPQITVGGITAGMEAMNEFLASREWQDISEKLMNYVENFSYKVVRARNGFQM